MPPCNALQLTPIPLRVFAAGIGGSRRPLAVLMRRPPARRLACIVGHPAIQTISRWSHSERVVALQHRPSCGHHGGTL
jgi:hypothetical protein